MDSLLLPLLLLIPLALIFTSGRRRQKEAAATQRRLSPGAQIITTAGLYATVVEVEDVAVVLEASPGVRTRWARGAVARVVSEPGEAAGTDGAATSDADLPATGSVADPLSDPVVDPGTGTSARPDAPGGSGATGSTPRR